MATVFFNGQPTEVTKDADNRDVANFEDFNVRQGLRTEVQQQADELVRLRALRDAAVLERDAASEFLTQKNGEIVDYNTKIQEVRAQRDANVAYLQGKGDDV
jgi:hypothetical protein